MYAEPGCGDEPEIRDMGPDAAVGAGCGCDAEVVMAAGRRVPLEQKIRPAAGGHGCFQSGGEFRREHGAGARGLAGLDGGRVHDGTMDWSRMGILDPRQKFPFLCVGNQPRVMMKGTACSVLEISRVGEKDQDAAGRPIFPASSPARRPMAKSGWREKTWGRP